MNDDNSHTTGACVFPAFGAEYLGNEQDILVRCGYDFSSLVKRAKNSVDYDPGMLMAHPDGFFPDELHSQYTAFLYSCAFSDIITNYGVPVSFCSGYSMGIYAALYYCGACSFEDGLFMIREAYKFITKDAREFDFAMGVIVGLNYEDVAHVIERMRADVEIINVNNRHSFSVAGMRKDVTGLVDACRKEGALNARVLPMSVPYHSRYMNGAAENFHDYCLRLNIQDPVVPMVSTITQELIRTRDDVIRDLSGNINTNINWNNTMNSMVLRGVTIFYECGPGRTLQKLAKFIDGDFTVYTIKKFPSLISSSSGVIP